MTKTSLVASMAAALALAACTATPRHGEMRQYTCADGTAFSLEVTDGWVRLHTATGSIELPRERHPEHMFYTNGLRSLIMLPDGSARHATGRRAWTDCEWAR